MDQDTFYRLTAMNAPAGPAGDAARLMDARHAASPARSSHSCELVATLDGVDLVNDSRSTFLDATLQSISALGRPVIWIAGLAGVEFAQGPVLDFLKEHVTSVILFGKAGHRNTELMDVYEDHAYVADDVRTAVFLARELARSGDVVLFSPACPSGDGFANYEERGMEFKRAVRDL